MRPITACVLVGIVFLGASGSLRAECPTGELRAHHDGTFEWGYTWAWINYDPAPYGCFGEGYDLGPGVIECAAYWLTAIPPWGGLGCDLYVWQGGVTREPGDVIALFPEVTLPDTPYWPNVAQNDYEMGVRVEGEFTVGYWDRHEWDTSPYIAADCDGSPGHPWTCVPPGHQLPTGWHDPSDIWDPPCTSLGIGVYFTADPTPAAPASWGAIKSLFR